MKLYSILLILWIAAVSIAAEYPKRVSPYVIHDGDTFVAAQENVVYRLWGVDAPELDQPWGVAARSVLHALIHKRAITLQSSHGSTYGRPVVMATVRGKDVGLELLKMGLAWHDPRYAPNRKDYAVAMDEAKKSGRGLWSDKNPISPWDWRAQKKYQVIDEEDERTGEK